MSATRKAKAFDYRVCGLSVSSEIPLPELCRSARNGRAQVHIRKGPVRPAQATFRWEGESRVRVTGGRRILVDALPQADPRQLRLSILGPALVRLLTQRGRLVLHASAVRIGGSAVVFVGPSGAGKSTLAAAFCARGHTLITDNFLVVRFSGRAAAAMPAFPQIKLWPDSAVTLGHDPKFLPQIDAQTRKHWLSADRRFACSPVRLKRIYLLSRARRAGVADASQAKKLYHLLRHSAGFHSPGDRGALMKDLKRCRRLLERVPVRLLKRAARLSTLEHLVKAVERDLGDAA